MRVRVVAMAAVLAVALYAFGAPPPAGSDDQAAPVVELPSPLDLARLVDLTAARRGVAVEYDASALKGTITLRMSGGVSDDELWSLTNQLLASRGFTTVRSSGGRVLRVVRVADAPQESGIGGEAGAEVPKDRPGFESVVLRVSHLTAAKASEALKPLLSKQGSQATPIGDGGLLLVSDLRPRLARALEILKRLDVPGETVSIEPYRPQRVGAEQLATLTAQVAAKRDLVSGSKASGEVLVTPDKSALLVIAPKSTAAGWMDLIRTLDQREPVERRTYTLGRCASFGLDEVASLIERTILTPPSPEAAGAGAERASLIRDDLTGSLIVTATASQQERVTALLKRLDSAAVESPRRLMSIPVRNRDASDLLSMLQELIDAGALGPATTAGVEPDAAATDKVTASTQTTKARSSPASATHTDASKDTTSRDAARPARADAQGSKPHTTHHGSGNGQGASNPQLTLTVDKATNTLIAVGPPPLLRQLKDLVSTLDVRQPQVQVSVVMVSLSDSDSSNLGVELERLEVQGGTLFKLSSLFGLSMATGGTGDGSGGSSSTSTGDFAVGRTVADGSGFTGVVLDPGEFSVVVRALETVSSGRSVSRPRLLVDNNEAATFDSVLQQPVLSTNASSTVATTSQTGFESAGTQVTVTPRIANGDHLALEYAVTQSAFVGQSSGPGITPPRQQTNVTSVATVPDGYTVAVGGIDQTTDSDGQSRVPILGSIPLIGEVFKSRTNSRSHSRFYVFITANVMRGETFAALKHISDRDAAEAQIDDGWPVPEPRVIK